ncbi:MAG: DUF1080 domain-containing protein [Planctomycetota bacterium]|nr:DUF1080 domain-containing protein [Planctomycetota bacterium]
MKIYHSPPMVLALSLCLLLVSCDSFPSRDSETVEQTALFDGETLGGWYTDIPDADDGAEVAPSFVARDGLLVSQGNPQGHLITQDSYSNYQLVVEYRWAGPPGNCGVLVHASTPRRLYEMFPQSIECQLFDGNAGDFWCIGENIEVDNMTLRRGNPDAWGVEENHRRRILNLTDDSENPPGEWNQMVIQCRDDNIVVWVNGDLVNHGYNCTARSGQIAIQAEGAIVEFRRLDLSALPAEETTAAE